ncbi:MAG: iron-containing alcohol dehydrogenase [Desulfohalobiaceae bacterium]|nr:iron-containing alcohol dehydrogenase [Desulfohalobiaceae bacterium]
MFKTLCLRTPSWIHFGMGSVSKVATEAKRLGGKHVMIITDQGIVNSGLLTRVTDPLESGGLEYSVFDQVEPEPSLQTLQEASKIAKENKCDLFIGLGGGSSMDTTKMVSALMTNDGRLQDFFGVDNVKKRGLPTMMITTTSGTGSEVSRMAVFTDKKANLKKVVSAQNILCDVAIVDPELTESLPPHVTAATGIDAFIHALEGYIAVNSNPVTDTIALEAIRLISGSLGPAFAGKDREARYNMSLGSLMGGIVLNNAGAGVIHALAYPIGAEYHLSHGKALMPIFAESLREIAVSNFPKLKNIGLAMGLKIEHLSPLPAADAAIDGMVQLANRVKLPTALSDIKADKSKVQEWAQAAHGEQRLLGNTPVKLTLDDVAKIFERSF